MATKATKDVHNTFSAVLTEAYRLMQYAESKVDSRDITITNYHVQSIGNVVGSHMVEVSMTLVSGEHVEVKTHNFVPARNDVAGYDGETVSHVKRNSGLLWEKASTGNFKQPDKEAVAWIGYMFDTLIKGDCLSGESGLKIGILCRVFFNTLKVKTCEIKIARSAEQAKPFVFNLTQIRSILSGLQPRWELVDKLPTQERTRKANPSVKVSF